MTLRPIKLLVIEDSDDDAFLLIHNLKKANYEPEYKQVETADELRSALTSEQWDIIISDHNLPQFNAIEALDVLKEFSLDLPLIVLSGDINQNIAVEAMRLGARDYIMKDDTSRLVPAIARELDASEMRMKMRQADEKNRRDLQAIMDHTPAVIYVKNTGGRYTFVNHKYEELFHLKRKDVIGKTDYDFFPEENAAQFESNDKAVLDAGRALESEEIVPQDDGYHTYISIKFPLYNNSNDIYAICGISTDITEYKQQNEQLRRSQKMEAIGQLSGGIAHDFNNQLNIIIGYLDFLDMHFTKEDKPYKWVQTALKATLRCVDLTRQLLSFSRRQTTDKLPLDLNNTFLDLQEIISRSVTPEIDVHYLLSEELWLAETNLGEFQDVVINLVINSRDALPHGGKIVIETKNTVVDDEFTNHNFEIELGDYVQFILTDTGSGIDKESLEHIFEPFFTTKPDGKGTGLGMAMVYGFVKRYEGYIKVYSEPGIGTTIRIYLPRSTASNVIDDHIELKYDLPTGSESVLIVDDEIGLLELAEKFFSELGYKTSIAENGNEALDILKADNIIDLLFSDVVMPGGMNGYELADKATQLRPNLKVLLTSGFTSRTIINDGLEKFSTNLLSKPYRKTDLAKRVRLVLDEM